MEDLNKASKSVTNKNIFVQPLYIVKFRPE